MSLQRARVTARRLLLPALLAVSPLLAASARASGASGAVGQRANERIHAEISAIARGLTATRYQHELRADPRRGQYFWDCSLMARWILARAAPQARSGLGTDRPLARDFYQTIARAPVGKPRRGWMRLTEPSSIMPGDLFAWLKPEMFRDRKNTGHVGFVIERPRPHPRHAGVWLVRIADATRELHGEDSRPPGGEGGFGTATLAFLFDPGGAAVAYGWYGEDQDPQTYVPTQIAFGRAFR